MRRAALVLALLCAALALVAAGCGGEETVTPTPETVEGTIPTEEGPSTEDVPALELEGNEADGEAVWAANGCGGCHVLAAAGSNGTVGPSLDETTPSYELAATRVTLGQGAMPAFGDQLEPQQIADVAAFVAENAGG